MGIRIYNDGGFIVCPYCKQKKNSLRNVEGLENICDECFKDMGGQDFLNAMKELNELYKGVKL